MKLLIKLFWVGGIVTSSLHFKHIVIATHNASLSNQWSHIVSKHKHLEDIKDNSQLLKKRSGTQPTNFNNNTCVVTKDCSLLKLQASLDHNDFLANLQQKKLSFNKLIFPIGAIKKKLQKIFQIKN